MESIKNTVLETVQKALETALQMVRTTAVSAANLAADLTGQVTSFASERAGALARTAGDKMGRVAEEKRQPLLLAAAVVSGLIAVTACVGFILGRKK